jgi:hypothetical protein
VLALGLVAGISLISSAAGLAANALLSLQLLGGGALSNLIAPMLNGFLTNLGLAAVLISLALSAALYALGRLTGRVLQLEARLARLEASLERP